MAIRLFVHMQAALGKRDDLKKHFAKVVPDVVKEKGCEQYEFFQSSQNPDKFILVERWTDQKTLDDHMEMNRKRGGDTSSLRTGESVVERYTV
ncbi:MAG: antibiotic biosynthesis monooxygenase [Chloroflexi bacterium]|nr:antibiotic biosynthesis monooxygenase [Chloroflexota bacterium]